MINPTENRKRLVFRAVVREYVATAEPVGSETVVQKYNFGVSPATIRNDMAELEERGYLEQPHTSAGRIPTALGYRFYVEQFVADQAQAARVQAHAELEQLFVEADRFARERQATANLRDFARYLAEAAEETVVVRFGDVSFCLGVGNLVNKPEFQEHGLLSRVSASLDEVDRRSIGLESRLDDGLAIMIGDENPFDNSLSSIVAVVSMPPWGQGIVGLVGPTRMDYDANVALLREVQRLCSQRFN